MCSRVYSSLSLVVYMTTEWPLGHVDRLLSVLLITFMKFRKYPIDRHILYYSKQTFLPLSQQQNSIYLNLFLRSRNTRMITSYMIKLSIFFLTISLGSRFLFHIGYNAPHPRVRNNYKKQKNKTVNAHE